MLPTMQSDQLKRAYADTVILAELDLQDPLLGTYLHDRGSNRVTGKMSRHTKIERIGGWIYAGFLVITGICVVIAHFS